MYLLFFSLLCISAISVIVFPIYSPKRRKELGAEGNIALDFHLPLKNIVTNKCIMIGTNDGNQETCNLNTPHITSCNASVTEQGADYTIDHRDLYYYSQKIVPDLSRPLSVYPFSYLCVEDDEKKSWNYISSVSLYTDASREDFFWETLRAKVKIFINPGWSFNFTVSIPGLPIDGVVSLKNVQNLCSGDYDQNSFRVLESQKINDNTFIYKANSSYRNSTERNELQKWRLKFRQGTLLHLCYYSNKILKNGIPIGQVQFLSDHFDAAALVGFIVFSILGVPIICAGVLSCTLLRLRYSRLRTKKIYLLKQQQEVEQELCKLLENE